MTSRSFADREYARRVRENILRFVLDDVRAYRTGERERLLTNDEIAAQYEVSNGLVRNVVVGMPTHLREYRVRELKKQGSGKIGIGTLQRKVVDTLANAKEGFNLSLHSIIDAAKNAGLTNIKTYEPATFTRSSFLFLLGFYQSTARNLRRRISLFVQDPLEERIVRRHFLDAFGEHVGEERKPLENGCISKSIVYCGSYVSYVIAALTKNLRVVPKQILTTIERKEAYARGFLFHGSNVGSAKRRIQGIDEPVSVPTVTYERKGRIPLVRQVQKQLGACSVRTNPTQTGFSVRDFESVRELYDRGLLPPGESTKLEVLLNQIDDEGDFSVMQRIARMNQDLQ
jgi:hypothetical protein